MASLTISYLPVIVLQTFLKMFIFRYKAFIFENPKSPSLLTKIWGVSFFLLLLYLKLSYQRFFLIQNNAQN